MALTVPITSLAHGGYGIAKVNDAICFVPEALPGDTVTIRVDKRSKGVQWGTLLQIVEPSPHRLAISAPQHGGNTWLHFAYPAQAEWKRRIVQECVSRLAGIDLDPRWIEDPELRLGHRTRAEFHGDGKRLGFYALQSHTIVDLYACVLLHPRLNEALQTLQSLDFRGSVEVVVNPDGEETLVWTKKSNAKLAKAFPLANSHHDGRTRSRFVCDGVPIVNGCFSQGSLLLNRLLVREVQEFVGNSPRILDLYCGNGNLSLGLPEHAEVTALDHSVPAVEAAQAVAQGDYRQGDEQAFAPFIEEHTWDCIILDPPRQGAKALCPLLANAKTESIVYVACDPAALGRDLKILGAAGWAVSDCAVIDLFPHTPHMETVCHLRRT
jgi:23S rRNA (uracil1939-C5)-methyltransferase